MLSRTYGRCHQLSQCDRIPNADGKRMPRTRPHYYSNSFSFYDLLQAAFIVERQKGNV